MADLTGKKIKDTYQRLLQLDSFISQNGTGSANLTALGISGSMSITGSLVVTEDIIARSISTQLSQSTVLYRSGSTKFGDTSDDRHEFTGSVEVTGSTTSTTFIGVFVGALSSSAQIASEISGSSTSLSSSLATDIATRAVSSSFASNIATNVTNIATNVTDITTLTAATASYALSVNNATTGSNTFTGNQIVSSSILLTLQQVTGSAPATPATGSLIVSGSPVQLYIYNGSGSGWNRV